MEYNVIRKVKWVLNSIAENFIDIETKIWIGSILMHRFKYSNKLWMKETYFLKIKNYLEIIFHLPKWNVCTVHIKWKFANREIKQLIYKWEKQCTMWKFEIKTDSTCISDKDPRNQHKTKRRKRIYENKCLWGKR